MKITKVYTRTGDKGMTSLVGGVRIQKSNVRLEEPDAALPIGPVACQ